MKPITIKTEAKKLAIELSKRSFYDIEDITTVISVNYRENIISYIKDYSNQLEDKYNALLTKKSIYSQGSRDYKLVVDELVKVQQDRSRARKSLNYLKENDLFNEFKEFVYNRFGDVYSEFLTSLNSDKKELVY